MKRLTALAEPAVIDYELNGLGSITGKGKRSFDHFQPPGPIQPLSNGYDSYLPGSTADGAWN
jgi:hypothetical protein